MAKKKNHLRIRDMYMLHSLSQNVTLVCCVINCKQDLVVPSLMNKGIEFSSSTLSMVPGIPIKPMLAKYIFLDALYASSFFFLFQVMQDAYKCFGLLFVLFVPCGRITNGIPQALKLFQNKAFTCEYKYAFFSLVDSFFSHALLISSMQFFKVSLNHIIN